MALAARNETGVSEVREIEGERERERGREGERERRRCVSVCAD